MVLLNWCSDAKSNGSRKLVAGSELPKFSITDISGRPYQHPTAAKRALMVAFLSAGHTRSVRAANDILAFLPKLGSAAKNLDVLIVFDDPDDPFCQAEKWKAVSANLHLAVDPKLDLWGEFGLIVMPSVVICNADNQVTWVEAGYGYNSAPVVHARLRQAMGLEKEAAADEAGEVKTVVNSTLDARLSRHVQMAKVLMRKGMFDMAVNELDTARKLDPNSIDLKLELGELYCRTKKPDAAIELLKGTEATGRELNARICLVLGWAHRIKKDLKTAEHLLLDAIKMDPGSVRALFELGKLYQAKGDLEHAVTTYRRALELTLDDRQSYGVSQ